MTNASVVRKFLSAVLMTGMPAPLCQKYSLVNNFRLTIYFKQWQKTEKRTSAVLTWKKKHYRWFSLKKHHKTHVLYIAFILQAIKALLYNINFASHLKVLWIMVTLCFACLASKVYMSLWMPNELLGLKPQNGQNPIVFVLVYCCYYYSLLLLSYTATQMVCRWNELEIWNSVQYLEWCANASQGTWTQWVRW